MICTCCIYPQRGGGRLTFIFKLLIHSITFILIIFLKYRRKFCDGHIILVPICMWKWCCDNDNIWFPVFDGFTRSGKSQARFDNFCLFVSVYACLSIFLCVRVWYKFWNEMKTICLFLGNACLSECASPSDKIFVAQGSSKLMLRIYI